MIGGVYGARYEVLQELESSPLFTSAKAMDRQTGREVRLRVLDPVYAHEYKFIESLKEHVQHLQAVVHPTLEKLYDFLEDEDNTSIVGEFVQSITLDERVKRLASFSVQLAVGTAVSVCEGVAAAHQAGIIHGDISGRNVLVTPSGTVKLTMTGFWSTYPNSSKAGLAMLKGMAPYLAPEVTAGSMPSVASDIYAVGVLTYQMLAGRCPYSGDSTVAIATKHASAPYPSLRAINPSVPEALDELVKKCLAKSPKERYASMNDLLSDLRGIQDALRFGRPLAWPIKKGPVEPAQVAPAIETPDMPAKTKRPPAKSKKVETDGMPAWATALFYLSILAVLGAIGAWVAFNTHQPKLIDLPSIVDKSQTDAAMELSKLGLRLSVEKQMVSEKFPKGVVMEQDPQPGPRKVKEGGIVQVVISAGGQFVEVPDLRGRSVAEAKKLLETLNLELNDKLEKVRDKDLEEGLIVSQIPEARKKVERASKIKVKVSNGNKRVVDEETPDQLYTYKLKITMPAGADSVLVRVDMTDDRETKTIFEEQRDPTDTFEIEAQGYGKEAIFRIFFDNELVKQKTQKAGDAEEQ